MNLGGWRFLVFALVGLGAIVLIASIGAPLPDPEVRVDRYSGERVRLVRTVADALAEARDTGDVGLALAAIRKRLDQFPEDEVLERTAAIFEAELAPYDAAPPEAHPHADLIAAERERAVQALAEAKRRVKERLNDEALVALLENLEADDAIAAEVERFFEPLVRWDPDKEAPSTRPDELAIRLLARIRDGDPPDEPEPFLKVIGLYRALGRSRARVRWLLRASIQLPDAREVQDALAAAYLEGGRLVEGFLALGRALEESPDDLDLWRQRALVAGWLSLPEEEAAARERLLQHGDDAETRERLITLYTYTGQPEKAVAHARALAAGSKDPAVLERPAQLALEAGRVDEAFTLLEALALESEDPAFWREKIVEYARQDLRVDRVIRELDLLRKLYPDRDYERQLESVYRQRNMTKELWTLLSERLEREPDNRELEHEVLALHSALGNIEGAKELILRQIDRIEDPRDFFVNLEAWHALKLDGIDERAKERAAGPGLTAQDVPFVMEQLRPFLSMDGYRAAAVVLARRFPGVPESREILVSEVDRGPDDEARARAAEELALEHAGDAVYLEAWIERAAWAGATESEIRARAKWVEHAPDDASNRRALADLYGAVERPREAVPHWRFLAEREGLGSEATLRLIDVLFATGQLEVAIELLEKRASLPEATAADRLVVANQLFGRSHFDRAARFYLAVLDLEPENPEALLRLGQVRSWTNDPRGAIPFLEKRLELTDERRAEVLFYLGEAHWSIRDSERGRRLHQAALDELLPKEPRDLDQDIMVAKMLARFGRVAEAQPIFERVLEAAPGQVDLILDYADSMTAIEDARKARSLVDRAKAIDPARARTMRLDGKVLVLEGRYEAAASILQESLARHGPDAGTESELGRALELSGWWRPARAAYGRSLTLQPDNRDIEQALHRIADRVADVVSGNVEYQQTGDDSILRVYASGSLLLADERLRVAASLGAGDYTGRAAAVNGGATDVEETALLLGLSGFYRFSRSNVLGGGIEAYPGAAGDTPAGGWLGVLWSRPEPYRALSVRVHGHTLLEEPAAAPGLGGRTSGIEVHGHHDFGRRFWASAELRYGRLSLEDIPGSPGDGTFAGEAVFGVRLHEGQIDVADRYGIGRTSLPLLEGPDVDGAPSRTPGPLASVWVSYQPVRLLDDRSLAALIPVGKRFDYLTLAGRADFHVAPSLGAKLEGGIGYELQAGEPFFHLDAGATWRPGHASELTLEGGYGRAFGRADAADSLRLRIAFTWRW